MYQLAAGFYNSGCWLLAPRLHVGPFGCRHLRIDTHSTSTHRHTHTFTHLRIHTLVSDASTDYLELSCCLMHGMSFTRRSSRQRASL